MDLLTALILSVPFVTALLLALGYRLPEHCLAFIATLGALMFSAVSMAGIGLWMAKGATDQTFDLFQIGLDQLVIHASMLWDTTSVVYLGLTVFCCLTIVKFSHYYMHRERGYARFFSVLFLLIGGVAILSLANNLDVFFAGWEVVGLASFLLIGFYHERKKSVQNALTVFTIYRVGDLGLLFAVWMSHIMPSGMHVGFNTLAKLMDVLVLHHEVVFIPITIALISAATAKSAQLPFSFWLPKAMEGPTPSSAIFYGALSVHAGVLLMLRTTPLWSPYLSLRILVAAIGVCSAVFATICGRSQPSIKGQLAYASVTQVGLMFLELALGWHLLVLYHMVAHAMLRVFQILVSPSIIVDAMHRERDIGHTEGSRWSIERLLPFKFRASLYVFAIQDGRLEEVMKHYIIDSFAWLSAFLHRYVYVWFALALLGILFAFEFASPQVLVVWSTTFISLQCAFALMAVFEKDDARRVWDFVCLSTLSVSAGLYPHGETHAMVARYFVTYSLPVWFLSRVILHRWAGKTVLSLKQFHGFAQRSTISFWILVGCAWYMSAIPPSPIFLTEDALLQSISQFSSLAAFPVGIALALCGLALIRCIATIGMGPLPTQSAGAQVARVSLKYVLPSVHGVLKH